MSSTISDIRAALANRLEATGIKALNYPPADSVGNELPVAYVMFSSGRYDATYGGRPLNGEIIITLLAASAENDEGWMELDRFLSAEGDSSILVALQEDSALGLPDVSSGVMGFQNAGFRNDLGGIWGADIIVNYIKAS